MKQAFAIARKNPRIQMMIWFLLKDEPVLGGWQSGLMTASGKLKPRSRRSWPPALRFASLAHAKCKHFAWENRAGALRARAHRGCRRVAASVSRSAAARQSRALC